MDQLNFGQIVLLKFPFTDGKSFKKRPALVLGDFEDGDILVCRITSQINNSVHDIHIESWKDFGLKLPSIIRVHKLATLEKNIVEKAIGEISPDLKNQVSKVFSKLIQ
ncbi:MAG: type II toxin-antitoxin system PemK/MazF family toxin [Balneolaceae bacterium]